MSRVFKDKNEEIFETFLIKEREQADIEKLHAQATIKYMAKCLSEEESKATVFTKIKWFLTDLIDRQKLKQIKMYNISRISKLKKENLCNKELMHKIINKKEFKIHIILDQIFDERTTITDCGGISYPYLCYKVYMTIEYCELLTQKHYNKEFEKINNASKYYDELLNTYKKKNIYEIFNKLTKEIDEHCDKLKERIEFFDKN